MIYKALKRHRQRSKRARQVDERRRAEDTSADYEHWAEDPSRRDYYGVDDGSLISFTAPHDYPTDVRRPPMDQVARMAGYGDRGYDVFEGVDALVMDGGPDAISELEFEDGLRMADDESIYRDDVGHDDMNIFELEDDIEGWV